MRIKKLLPILLCLAFFPAFSSANDLSNDWKNIESLYQQGRLDDLASNLFSTKTKNDEDRALQAFMSAMLKTSREDTYNLLRQTSERFPKTYYGQLGIIEQAKIHLLEREPIQARDLLQSVTSVELSERYYWLAVCADALNDHPATVSQGENYLRLEPQGKFLEEAYYLIASAYQSQGKHQSAIATLGKLGAIEGFPKHRQYFHYLMGSLYKLSSQPDEALSYFRQGFEINRNSQLAFQIEDGLFELKERYGSRIDLSFLYPYSAADTTDIVVEATVPEDLPQIDANLPIKLSAKPQGGYFVQAGRFGSESNANNLAATLRGLNLQGGYFEDKANKSTPWVVVTGPYGTKGEADRVRTHLVSNGIESFITQF